MNTVDERSALDHPMSLLEHATRLYQRHPDTPLPHGGRPYPDDGAQPGRPARRTPAAERRAALLSLLAAFFSDQSAEVQALHDDLSRLDLPRWMVESAIAKLPAVDAERARRTGEWLVRHATDRRPALVGLALLANTAQPDDIPLIRTIGLLELLGHLAVEALATIPGATADLIWLAERSDRHTRTTAIKALSRDPDAAAWLLRHAVGHDEMSASLARQVAEAVSLADALDDDTVDVEVLDQAGWLLLAMATTNDYRTALASYRDACRVYRRLAGHLADAPASMERLAMLVSLIEDLRTGRAACLDWPPGQRQEVLARLCTTVRRDDWRTHLVAALQSPDPLVRRRAEWAQAAIRDPVDVSWQPPRMQIHVVAPDPCRNGDVETRILVDGQPVVAAFFDKGAPYAPETLLGRGQLRATSEPREVGLAEAYCTEGCCGALYVSIVRDGDVVVWRDWRTYTSEAAPPEMRFSAAEYDAEIARAENDHTSEWPARTLARLLRTQLAAQPDLLARWQCHPSWISARPNEPTRIRFSFCYPELPDFSDSKRLWLQFERIIDVDHTPVAEQVAHIIEQLTAIDPKTQAKIVGGHRDHAEELGFPWPSTP